MSSIEATCDPVMASSVKGYKTQWDVSSVMSWICFVNCIWRLLHCHLMLWIEKLNFCVWISYDLKIFFKRNLVFVNKNAMYTRKRLVNLEILVQMIVFLKCAQVLIFPWFGCVRLIELQPQNCRCRVYVEIYINKIKQVIKR